MKNNSSNLFCKSAVPIVFLRKGASVSDGLLGICRAAGLLFCAITTFAIGVKAQTEPLTGANVFPARISLFDNVAFKYRTEINEGGRWKLRKKTEIFWDVLNQRAKVSEAEIPYSFTTSSAEKPLIVSWRMDKGVSLLIRKSADFDHNLEDIKGERNTKPATAVIQNGFMTGGRVRTIMDMYYEIDSISFRQMTGAVGGVQVFNDLDQNNILIAKGRTVFLLDKKDKSINGIIRYYEPILKKEDIKNDFFLKMNVLKKKMIDGVLFPLEIEQILVITYRDGGESKKKRYLEKIIVDEKSVSINRGINEKDMQLLIPAGSNVVNVLTNTTYVADGVSDDIYEEKLSTTLERVVAEAIKNKEESKR